MADFIYLMHNDATGPTKPEDWDTYISSLLAGSHFSGGSEVGNGVTVKGDNVSDRTTDHIRGFMRISARDLDEAKKLVRGNPHWMAGGTVEVRELPKS